MPRLDPTTKLSERVFWLQHAQQCLDAAARLQELAELETNERARLYLQIAARDMLNEEKTARERLTKLV